jgi:hypothetical protein
VKKTINQPDFAAQQNLPPVFFELLIISNLFKYRITKSYFQEKLMAKKKAKTAKTAGRTKIKCPVCECVVLVKLPKKRCASFCACPSCKETIEAHGCCILCDYGQKKPCAECNKK